MKPTLEISNPCDHQATTVDLDGGRAGYCRSSFCAISQDYFAEEEPQHFAQEAVLFVIMMITVALPLLNASIAILVLIRI